MNRKQFASMKRSIVFLSFVETAAALGPIYNVPPDVPPAMLLAGETLNLGVGGTTDFNFTSAAGSTINVNGGSIGFSVEVFGDVTLNSGQIGAAFQSRPGSIVDVYGGTVGFVSTVDHAEWSVYGGQVGFALNVVGGKLSIYDGQVESILASQQSEINLFGGEMGHPVGPIMHSTLNMTGGTLTNGFQFGEGSTWNLSGGVVDGDVEVSTFNILCKTVFVGGAPIAGLIPGVPHVVTQRNVTLSGVLLDDSPFHFDMNSSGSPGIPGVDRFPASATVTVTVVPEPGIAAMSIGLVAVPILRREVRVRTVRSRR